MSNTKILSIVLISLSYLISQANANNFLNHQRIPGEIKKHERNHTSSSKNVSEWIIHHERNHTKVPRNESEFKNNHGERLNTERLLRLGREIRARLPLVFHEIKKHETIHTKLPKNVSQWMIYHERNHTKVPRNE
jgi:hypothetical protein